jgi:uncharacterized repeat protein (TIGR03803 family)
MYNKSSRVNCAMKLPALALKIVLALSLFCAVAVTSSAQTFTTLNKFRGTNGANPYAPLVQGTNGDLYGTTFNGGADNGGTIFKMTLGGKLTTIYSFPNETGPYAGLVQATNGNFYGAISGLIFEITPGGTLTTLYGFCSQGPDCTDGFGVSAPLLQGTDGNLYGTTMVDGANNGGNIFKLSPSGTFSVLYSFCSLSGCTDGETSAAGLVQGADGSFYGTTREGGTRGFGTIFRITPTGKLTTLYTFCPRGDCTAGAEPTAALLLATDGNFYGTAWQGGPFENEGTVFKMTPDGTVTVLYYFCSQGGFQCTDGAGPESPLIQGTDGNFYGTTSFGGSHGRGTAFEIKPDGTFTTLYNFCSQSHCPDGDSPDAALFQATDGNFYGTTLLTWAPLTMKTGGLVYRLSTGLGPFVETLPTFGRAGGTIKILGTNLSGATSVSFNGTPAAFKVMSSSLITTNVPAGATSGSVTVTVPSGTLTSNKPFSVKH